MSNVASFKYKAFLSYSHRDKTWGEWLHRALENYKIDKDLVGRDTTAGPVPKSLRPIFRDRDDFAAGHSLTEQTLAALEASQFLIVVCSPNAAKSQYVNEEIRRFKMMGRVERVIAIIVDGEPGDAERECFPPALRFKVGADGTLTEEREEPIAADARSEGDSKWLALQKVVAALIGVSLDEVRKRYEIAWRRRTTIGALGSLCVAVLMIIAGYLYWHASEQNRLDALRIEKQHQHDAETAKQLADMKALVEKLVGASTAQVGPGAQKAVGEAVTAAAEGAAAGDPRLAKALELLQAGKPKDAEPLFRAIAEEKEQAAASSSREAAAAYRNLGAIAGLGDPKRAREAYAKAAALDPDDPEGLSWHGWFQFDAGNLRQAEDAYRSLITLDGRGAEPFQIFWARSGLGDIAVARGDLGAALLVYREGLTIAERLAAADPKDFDWQRNLSVSYEKVGNVLVAQGKLDDALRAFHDSLAIRDRLAKADPGDAGGQRDLSVSHNKVGDVLVAQGKLDDALASFRDSLAIRDRLTKADPGNAGWQRDLSVSYVKVGDVLVTQGKLDDALKGFRESLAIAGSLAKADPGNAGWQRDLSVSYNKVGEVLVVQGKLDDALRAFHDSLAIRDRLAKADPGNAGWQRDLSVSHTKIGGVLVRLKKPAEALTHYRIDLEIAEKLAPMDPSNAGWRNDLVISHRQVIETLRTIGMNKLSAEQKAWLNESEAKLAGLTKQ